MTCASATRKSSFASAVSAVGPRTGWSRDGGTGAFRSLFLNSSPPDLRRPIPATRAGAPRAQRGSILPADTCHVHRGRSAARQDASRSRPGPRAAPAAQGPPAPAPAPALASPFLPSGARGAQGPTRPACPRRGGPGACPRRPLQAHLSRLAPSPWTARSQMRAKGIGRRARAGRPGSSRPPNDYNGPAQHPRRSPIV